MFRLRSIGGNIIQREIQTIQRISIGRLSVICSACFVLAIYHIFLIKT